MPLRDGTGMNLDPRHHYLSLTYINGIQCRRSSCRKSSLSRSVIWLAKFYLDTVGRKLRFGQSPKWSHFNIWRIYSWLEIQCISKDMVVRPKEAAHPVLSEPSWLAGRSTWLCPVEEARQIESYG